MAFSQKSIGKSQIPIKCQLCEGNPKIQWKCKDCNLLMCQPCRDNIHPKFKDASKHQICDIKEIGLSTEGEETNINFSNIPCQKHKGQDYCLFCKACNFLVCATCVSTKHNGHKMGEIKEFYEIKKDTVRKQQREVKINERRLKEDELLLDKIKQSKSESYNKAKNEIISQKKALIEVVSIHAAKFLYDLDQDYQSTIKTYDDGKGDIQKLKLELNKQSTELEHISSTNEAAAFLKKIENFTLVKKDVTSIDFPDNIVTKFFSGHIMQSSFGSLKKMTKRLKYKIMLETPKEFQTELNQICLIAVDNNNSLWLSDYESYLLQKVKLEDNHIEVLNSFNIKAFGIAVNEFNDLLLCTGDTRIKQINNGTDQVVDSVYNAAPFVAGSIHITKEKVIVCGGIKGRSADTVVILMDLKGKRQAIYEHYSNSKPLFKMPCNISSTYNGNIFCVDVDVEAGEYKVVVLGTTGTVIDIYDGNKDFETMHSCIFFGIATTPKDHIVVADQLNHSLHVLDSDGHFSTYYEIEDIGISYPASLAFNLEGQLYIGCTGSTSSTPDDRKKKAKLYEVNFYEY